MKDIDLTTISDFKITSADTDFDARIRLGSIVNLLIQSAINSADNMGFGFDGLQKQNLFWILSRIEIEILKPLKWYHEVHVETWPKNLLGLLYIRDYIIRDTNNEIIAKATSGWLAVDSETMRPKIIKGMDDDIFSKMKNKNAIEAVPQRLSGCEKGEQTSIRASYFDIDLNKHVTSTRYIDWMMDTFPLDFHKKNYPSKLSVNYLRETKPDETIVLTKQQINDNEYLFEGLNSGNNTNAFRGKISF